MDPTFIKILHFVSEKHATQTRKDSKKSAYIIHLTEVCNLLSECGVTDTDTLAGALAHDIIEDQKVSKEELISIGGKTFAQIVMECTDDKSLSKIERKKHQLEHAKVISNSAKMIKLADKYSNTKDLLEDAPLGWSETYRKGYAIWSYCVCRNCFGVNEQLDNKLKKHFDSLFKSFGIDYTNSDDLNKILEKYYELC